MSSNGATPPQAASPKSSSAPEPPPPAEITPPPRKRRVVRWVVLAILIGAVFWVSIIAGPVAQEVRELAGFKPDRIILDSAFSIGPHTFRYYNFSLPEVSANVAVIGQFKSASGNSTVGSRMSPAVNNSAGNENGGDQNKAAGVDNGIEAYVLTEPAFRVWQKGSATSSLYDSGNVAQSTVQADIPAGAGIYYLVFSNKSSPETSKSVHATVVLRYRSWLRRALTR